MQTEENIQGNIVNEIAKNSGLVIASKVIRGLIEMLVVVLLARYLGVSGFGIY